MKIYKEGSVGLIDTGIQVYSFEISAEDARTPMSDVVDLTTWKNRHQSLRVGDYTVLSLGDDNMLPDELREILDENNLSPEILNKQTQLLWGQGPALYRERFENGKRVKYWEDDKDIKNWLKSWKWKDYLLQAVVEFRHMNGHFTKYYRNKGPRIGSKGFITHLEHISSVEARLEYPKHEKITHVITGDYNAPWRTGLKRYPLFDEFNPFRYGVAMNYSHYYSFAMPNDYAKPPFFGILNWIKLGSALPVLLQNYNVNAASIRYHIKSPGVYWEAKRDQLIKNCELKGVEYKEAMLEDLKDEIFKKFGEGLVGLENAGKIMTSETIYDEIGHEYVGWEVDVIDPKVKSFVSAQVEIAKRAGFEITAGFGLHPALSNMSADGNLPSGSEQLYAFKLYLSTGVDIPEFIVCRDVNNAIAANFPDKDLQIGFYHDNILTEEATTPSERIKNQK